MPHAPRFSDELPRLHLELAHHVLVLVRAVVAVEDEAAGEVPELVDHVDGLVKRAQAVYRQSSHGASGERHKKVRRARSDGGGSMPSGPEIRRSLQAAAEEVEEGQALARIMARVRKSDEEIARALGW